MTQRMQHQDAPDMLPPARAAALREASRRGVRVAQEQAGQVPLPSLVPPSMQPGQPVPQLVPAETLDQLTQLMTQRINAGDEELARRVEQLGHSDRITGEDLAVRIRALRAARGHVRSLLAATGTHLDPDARIVEELRIAKFLLGES